MYRLVFSGSHARLRMLPQHGHFTVRWKQTTEQMLNYRGLLVGLRGAFQICAGWRLRPTRPPCGAPPCHRRPVQAQRRRAKLAGRTSSHLKPVHHAFQLHGLLFHRFRRRRHVRHQRSVLLSGTFKLTYRHVNLLNPNALLAAGRFDLLHQ